MLSFINTVANTNNKSQIREKDIRNVKEINKKRNVEENVGGSNLNKIKCLINKGDIVMIVTSNGCEIARKYKGNWGAVIEVARRQKKNIIFRNNDNKEIKKYELMPKALVQVEIYINNKPTLIQTDIGNLKLIYPSCQ